ncbi:MAG: hypothetical protein AB8F94_28155 [Saprospiraceae bacterium]
MRNNTILSLSIIFILLGSASISLKAQGEKINLSTFTFTVPDGMTHHPNNPEVLAKLSFEKSLHITIDNNMEKMLELTKKRPKGKERTEMEQMAFDLKFESIQKQYRGYDPTKKQSGTLKTYNYTTQMFTCKASKTQEAYLEYRVMEIGGKHYEFIITGKKEAKKKHLPLIKNFWKSIVVN